MSAFVKFVDETPAGDVLRELKLHVAEESLTVRALIERRVRHEVARFNDEDMLRVFNGLVQPDGAEAHQDGYRLQKARRLDAEQQCSRALSAFERNGFCMLVGDRQVESLDEEIALVADTKIAFIKLVPLVGG